METTWLKCSKCDGKGYHYSEHLGSYPCELCDGVGRIEGVELPEEELPPTLVRLKSGYVLPVNYHTRNRGS